MGPRPATTCSATTSRFVPLRIYKTRFKSWARQTRGDPPQKEDVVNRRSPPGGVSRLNAAPATGPSLPLNFRESCMPPSPSWKQGTFPRVPYGVDCFDTSAARPTVSRYFLCPRHRSSEQGTSPRVPYGERPLRHHWGYASRCRFVKVPIVN